jgi:FMN phosphatase YigB (HAD superfamily)
MNKTVYVDMDNVLVDFHSAFPRVEPEVLKQYEEDKDHIPGLFALMDPMDGAIEAFKKLTQHFDTYILSTAPWKNDSAWSHKAEWVKKHLGVVAYKRLIITHHKNLNKGDYLIDDRTKNGAGLFEGEHILFGGDQFKTWDDVIPYLIPEVPPRIAQALELMEHAHEGQKDKAGFPYREHPLYLFRQFNNESQKIVALLHDVFEDTAIEIEDVSFLTPEEAEALQLMTKEKGCDYNEYINAIKNNSLARAVKIEDLKHNLLNRGWEAPKEKIEKYNKSLKTLSDD